MMDRFFRKPAENPLKKKMDELRGLDAKLLDLNKDINRLKEKMNDLHGIDKATAAHAQDVYFKETGDMVTIDEMRDTFFEKIQQLKKLRKKIREEVHDLLVKETDVIDPDKKRK